MTTIDPANLKKGDRIRYSRVVTVERDGVQRGRYGLRIHTKTESGGLCNPSLDGLEIELLERPLPAEPAVGSVVIFRPPNERHLTQTTVYQHFADHWQSTRIGGQDRYAWADVLKIHEGELLEVLVTTP